MITVIAQAPALPLHAAGKYVAGAYIVFVLVLLSYLAIMALRLGRNQKEIMELRQMIDVRDREQDTDAREAPEPDPAEQQPTRRAQESEPVA